MWKPKNCCWSLNRESSQRAGRITLSVSEGTPLRNNPHRCGKNAGEAYRIHTVIGYLTKGTRYVI